MDWDHATVTKRDGREVSWDDARILRAVGHEARSPEVPARVLAFAKEKLEGQSEDNIGVEAIQDLVEEALMELGEHDHARHYIHYRRRQAEFRADRGHPDPLAISDYTHVSKYGRHQAHLGRREVWPETVDRLFEMHAKKFPSFGQDLLTVFEEFVKTKLVIPSARSLQFGGGAIEANNARMYNCSFTFADRARFFQELFFLLLSGCGCGFSVQRRHARRMPSLSKINRAHVHTHQVGDDIVGWADALGALVNSYMGHVFGHSSAVAMGMYVGMYVEFDFSQIRPEGSTLFTSGGKAPGHIPLKLMLERVRVRLDKAQGRKLKPIEIHDIACEISIAVLAGGIRRSAMISLFDVDDADMMNAKTGEWWKDEAQRAMANNSAVFSRVDADEDKFKEVFEKAREYGEPGFYLTSGDYGCNPCGEIGLNPVDPDNEYQTGWAFCNLTEINGSVMREEEEFLNACRAAAVIGTVQASYTNIEYLGDVTKRIIEREALLGVSITGLQDSPLFKDGLILKTGADMVKATNRVWSKKLGIREAARTTTVKPSGTLSLLLGGIGAGIHQHHARRYFRRVLANRLEEPFLFFRQQNPYHCEEKPDGDWVVTFPIEAPSDAVLREDQTAIEFMDFTFHVFENWILPGTAKPFSSQGLTHNVSCTVTVREDEWAGVCDHAWRNRRRISSMSFLPWTGDKDYAFAPREEVTTEADEAKWKKLIGSYRRVDWSKMTEGEDGTTHVQTPACEGQKCEIEY